MLTYADGPDMSTSLSDSLWLLLMGAVLVVTFYVLRAKARRKARTKVGVVYESPYAPLVPVQDGDMWFDGADTLRWEHDRWVPADFEQVVRAKARIAA